MTETTARAFTEQFKARNRLIANTAIVLGSVTPFALGLLALEYVVPDPPGWYGLLVVVLALGTSGGFTWLAQNRFALLGNERLRRVLEARVSGREEFQRYRDRATFVGFAPGDRVMTWDGETDLDVGFLCVAEDTLVFLGDRYSWSLARERVDRIELSPPSMGPRRIIVYWHAPREPGRALTLESREARWLSQVDRATVNLFKTLRKWSVAGGESSGERIVLGHPPTGTQGGRPLDEVQPGSCATVMAMTVIIVLTAWYLVAEMLKDGFRYHAVLWAGFVFVGGAVFTRCVLHYLQSTAPPRHQGQRRRS